ncbi:Uncharacterised protein [Vibrio cholerae]|nr:Uncharacterised protein [Vibrio cholerae]
MRFQFTIDACYHFLGGAFITRTIKVREIVRNG